MQSALQHPGDPPLYLFYLDRELCDAAEFQLSSKAAETATKVLTLATASMLYCGISILLESSSLASLAPMGEDLVQGSALRLVSNQPTLAEHIDLRRRTYAHDRERYPVYFEKSANPPKGLQPTFVGELSATASLHRSLTAWVAGEPKTHAPVDGSLELNRLIRGAVGPVLEQREDKAITFALFRPTIEAISGQGLPESVVRRRISLEYAAHYLALFDGVLPTGIDTPLSYFEVALGRDRPFHDVGVLQEAMIAAGLKGLLDVSWTQRRDLWQQLIAVRSFPSHSRLVDLTRWLIASLVQAAQLGSHAHDPIVVAQFVRSKIRSVAQLDPRARPPTDIDSLLQYAGDMLEGAIKRLADTDLRPFFDATAGIAKPPRADALLVTATKVETVELLDVFGHPPGSAPPRRALGNLIYYDLGIHRGSAIWAVQSEMGAGSPGGSMLTVMQGIDTLDPYWVLTVGIAFGVDEKEQRIGDLLLCEQLVVYERARVGTGPNGEVQIVDRADRPKASPALLSRLRSAELDYPHTVLPGAILTGEKLIDNIDFRDSLRSLASQIVGGEMEGAGISSSAELRKRDWGLAKAICDWGDGKKGRNKAKRQKLAAQRSAEFARHAATAGVLKRP
jgi:nucleoside phosphorylase